MLRRGEDLLAGFLSGRWLSPSTRDNYRCALKSFIGLGGVPIEDAGEPDLGAWYRRACARGLAAATIRTYALHLGRLLEYALRGRGLAPDMAHACAVRILKGVPMTDLRREIKRATPGREKLVTPEELTALMSSTRHPRARALIAVLHESGCRKGEILGLRVRDAQNGDRFMEIRVLGKTGERTIPLVRSRVHLRIWLEAHPDPRPGAPLFATVVDGEVRRMDARTPNRLLRDLCARASLRSIHPQMLRHTRLTELARKGVGEYVLKSFAGWTPDSKMAARYIHLSGRAHIDAILEADRVQVEEAEA